MRYSLLLVKVGAFIIPLTIYVLYWFKERLIELLVVSLYITTT